MILDTTTGRAWVGDFQNTLKPLPPDAPFFEPKIPVEP